MNRRLAEALSLDRLAARLPAGLRYALAFLVLAGLLGAMIGHRALILRDGAEVRLAIVPVDPRDLFRGDYVVLTYEIGELRLDRIAGDKAFRRGDPIHVVLRPDGDGRARAVSAHRTRPSGSAVSSACRAAASSSGSVSVSRMAQGGVSTASTGSSGITNAAS